MEVLYKKDLEKSYMLIKLDNEFIMDYRMKMICKNIIKGLCPVTLRQFNNDKSLYYDISGMISVKNKYWGRKMLAHDIRAFIVGIQKLVESMKEYLLDLDKIILDFEYIYMDSESDNIYFCYYPEKEEDFFVSLHNVLNKIIEVADHSDRETVILSYGLQQLGTKDNVTISELIKFVNEEGVNKIEGAFEDENDAALNSNDVFMYDNKEENRERERKKQAGKLRVDREQVNEKRVNIKQDNKEDNKKSGIEKILEADFVSRIKKVVLNKKDRYKTLEDIEQPDCVAKEAGREIIKYNNNSTEQDSYSYEETVVLNPDIPLNGIILKAANNETNQTIIPRYFPCIIGKSSKSSDYVIENKTISRVHLKISENSDGFYIEDLNSTNGSFLNGNRLAPYHPVKINMGDKITLSEMDYIVC